jgi:hypothetical protein
MAEMKRYQPKTIKERLVQGAVDIYQNPPEPGQVSYQHLVIANNCMPYRNPGEDVKLWKRSNGQTGMMIEAGAVYNPKTNEHLTPGLPFGPKARIILIFLHHEAIKHNSPVIYVEENMTALIHRLHGDKVVNGRVIRAYKEQLARLSSCYFTLAVGLDDQHAINQRSQVIEEFDLWFPKDREQRVLWNSSIRLSDKYFQTLKRYMVPLDERAVANLSNNAMALDIYAWLAQRLHRIQQGQPYPLAWQTLREQFGDGYKDMFNFKRVFRKTLDKVLTQYPAARGRVVEEENKGYWLHKTAPPVPYMNEIKPAN